MTHEAADILISKIVGGDASEHEWASFTSKASERPELWQRLVMTQHDDRLVRQATEHAISAADHVELPASAFELNDAEQQQRKTLRIQTHLRARQWAGWAVAAVAGLAFLVNHQVQKARTGTQTQHAALPAGNFLNLDQASPDEVLNAYLDKGQTAERVVGMVPTKILMDTRPAEGGQGYEVLYVRQIIERTRIKDLYQLEGVDEHHQPVFARFTPTTGSPR